MRIVIFLDIEALSIRISLTKKKDKLFGIVSRRLLDW